MAAPTYEQLLEQAQAAASALMQNQSYSLNGRTLTRVDLKKLQDWIEWLEGRIAYDANTNWSGNLYVRFTR